MAFNTLIEYDYTYTGDWVSTVSAGKPFVLDDDKVLHPNMICKAYVETQVISRRTRIAAAYATVALRQSALLQDALKGIPGWGGILSVTNSPFVPGTGLPSLHKLPTSVPFVDYVKTATDACEAGLANSLFDRLVCGLVTYAACAGCLGKATTHLSTQPAKLILPRFYFTLPTEKKIAFLKSLTDADGKLLIPIGYEDVLGLCRDCRVKCGKCNKKLSPASHPRYARMLSLEGVCHLCNAEHLSNATAPTLTRTMLTKLSNSKIILD